MVDRSADAVVIGAGVLGSSIALELARGGRDVVVIDKAGGAGHGSTSASSGIVRFHYSTYAGVALAWEALHGWHDWAGHLGHVDPAGLARLEQTGMLVLDRTPGASAPVTALLDQVGVPWEWWDTEQIAARLPHLDTGAFGPPAPVQSDAFFAEAHGSLTGTFTPDAGYVGDPALAAQNLAVAATAQGATILLHREVVALGSDGPRRWRVVLADGDTYDADVVVNAAGPWSGRVNALAGAGSDFTVTTRPMRQEVHELATAGTDPRVIVADPDLGIYTRPAGPGRMIVGGMEPECDPPEWLDDADVVNPHPTVPVFEAQVLRAARRFPDLAVPNRPVGIAGVYDVTTDWAPIYDRTDRPGFYVAIGTSGNQFKNAPVVGTLMRTLIDAVEAGHDHDRDPVRLTLPRTGREVDLSAWSRRRPVAADRPRSVLG
ncbi:FAD-dependent oxidoreductase [Nocardioides sp.]|uniref:NAD(P)/FAD-dependent oxidoreductase n=1 Tax=Nocardioides sp. TaxID=35761 RepID=UPI002ED4487F